MVYESFPKGVSNAPQSGSMTGPGIGFVLLADIWKDVSHCQNTGVTALFAERKWTRFYMVHTTEIPKRFPTTKVPESILHSDRTYTGKQIKDWVWFHMNNSTPHTRQASALKRCFNFEDDQTFRVFNIRGFGIDIMTCGGDAIASESPCTDEAAQTGTEEEACVKLVGQV